MLRFALATLTFSLWCAAAGAQPALSISVHTALTRPDLLILSEVLRPRDGVVHIARGAIEPGTVLLSIPVAHRRTIVVNQDLGEGAGILVSPRVLENGARGYWSGNFSPFQQVRGDAVWCFLDERQARARSLCLAPRVNERAPASRSRNVYLASQLEISTDDDDYWETPLVVERPVAAIHDDLRVEYVFEGWREPSLSASLAGGLHAEAYAQIEIRIGGNVYEESRLAAPRERLVLPTAVGDLTLVRSGRDAVVSVAPATAPLTAGPSMLNLPSERPIPVLRARSSVQPDTEMRTIVRGADLFTQEVAPAAAYMIDRSPTRADERAPRALGPFSTFRANGHDVICVMERPANPRDVGRFRLRNGARASKSWDYCLEDADGEPGFEAMHNFLGYPDRSNVGLWWTTGAGPINEIIEANETDFAWPSETIHLRYIATMSERQTPVGLRPTVAVFAIVLGNSNRLQPDWWVLPVQLNEQGRGELRLGGQVVARIEDVGLDGSARVQVIAGLPESAAPLLNPADFAPSSEINARLLRSEPERTVPFIPLQQ